MSNGVDTIGTTEDDASLVLNLNAFTDPVRQRALLIAQSWTTFRRATLGLLKVIAETEGAIQALTGDTEVSSEERRLLFPFPMEPAGSPEPNVIPLDRARRRSTDAPAGQSEAIDGPHLRELLVRRRRLVETYLSQRAVLTELVFERIEADMEAEKTELERKQLAKRVEQLEAATDELRTRAAERIRQIEAELRKKEKELAAFRSKYEEVRALSVIDALTGLKNLRGFENYVQDFLPRTAKIKLRASRGDREQLKSSYVVHLRLDLDKFKAVNEAHGHDTGDLVLKAFANVLQKRLRQDIDMFARTGGEEFNIVMLVEDLELGPGENAQQKIREVVLEKFSNLGLFLVIDESYDDKPINEWKYSVQAVTPGEEGAIAVPKKAVREITPTVAVEILPLASFLEDEPPLGKDPQNHLNGAAEGAKSVRSVVAFKWDDGVERVCLPRQLPMPGKDYPLERDGNNDELYTTGILRRWCEYVANGGDPTEWREWLSGSSEEGGKSDA